MGGTDQYEGGGTESHVRGNEGIELYESKFLDIVKQTSQDLNTEHRSEIEHCELKKKDLIVRWVF